MTALWFIIPALLVLIWGVLTFNRLVKEKNIVAEAWSGIDVQLKKRHNLIPNLVELVKVYAKHERDVLENVTSIRSEVHTVDQVGQANLTEGLLTKSLTGLFGLIENYPDLKADKNFLSLQDELVQIEDDLQHARRYYNGAVRDINTRILSFPHSIVANIGKFECFDFFEVESPFERQTPSVSMEASAQ